MRILTDRSDVVKGSIFIKKDDLTWEIEIVDINTYKWNNVTNYVENLADILIREKRWRIKKLGRKISKERL